MKSISRRTFLGTATLAALQPRFAIGQEGESANAKLNIALIGAGGMARAAVEDCRDENFVAFCDVDDRRCRATYRQYPYVPTFTGELCPVSEFLADSASHAQLNSNIDRNPALFSISLTMNQGVHT